MSRRALPIFLSFMCVASPALADDKDEQKKVCRDSYVEAQTLRDAHELKGARDQLRVCSRASCTPFIVKDCTEWLQEVEGRLPSVVLSAKEPGGHPGQLPMTVTVLMDGAPFATTLDGASIEVDPGWHAFEFVAGDGRRAKEVALVLEGRKAQSIAAVFPGVAVDAERPAALGPPAGTPSADRRSRASTSGWTTVGWIVGGAGVVGLGVGAGFGLLAMGDKNSARCDASNQCDAGPLGDARNAAHVSNVGLIAGGLLVASGVALVAFGPRASDEYGHRGSATSLRIAPTLGNGTGGIVVGGGW
jgi:hypothetical protein